MSLHRMLLSLCLDKAGNKKMDSVCGALLMAYALELLKRGYSLEECKIELEKVCKEVFGK